MKTSLLVLSTLVLLAGSALAGGRGGVYVNFGGGGYCGPRYYAPPVCYTPRQVYYRPAPVCYAPPVYYAPAPVVYSRPYYAPVVRGGVIVSTTSFGWRR